MWRSVLLGVVLAGVLAGCGSSSVSTVSVSRLLPITAVGTTPRPSTGVRQDDAFLERWLGDHLHVSPSEVTCGPPLPSNGRRFVLCTAIRSSRTSIQARMLISRGGTFRVVQMVMEVGGQTGPSSQ